jgi:hypothetical protein
LCIRKPHIAKLLLEAVALTAIHILPSGSRGGVGADRNRETAASGVPYLVTKLSFEVI